MVKKKTILEGALILTAAGVITRLLGFAYRIYMSNIIGAEGMGLYQLINPIYMLAWSVACSGLTTSVTRYIAANMAKKEYGNMGRALKIALILSTSIALVLSALMFFGAEEISNVFLHDKRTVLPIKILALALPFMAAGSSFRSYFLGLSQPLAPAVCQILEQVVRMVTVYGLSGLLIPRGLEYACAAAVCGVVTEEITSCIYIFISYRRFKQKNGLVNPPTESVNVIFSALMSMAVPLTANRVCGSLLSAVENILIPLRLQLYGMTAQQAVSAFGQVTGMALPLIFFPSALLTSLSIALVPAISEAVAAKNAERITSSISKAFLLTALIGIMAAAIFTALNKELGQVIYHIDLGEPLLLFGLMCPFWYLNITMSGILNGLGQQKFIFKMSLLGSALNIAAIWFVVPKFGIPAFILGWFVSLLITTVLNVLKISESGKIKFNAPNWVFKPVLAAATASLVTRVFSRRVIFPNFGGFYSVLISVALICAIYLSLIFMLGCLTKDDLAPILSKFRRNKDGNNQKQVAV